MENSEVVGWKVVKKICNEFLGSFVFVWTLARDLIINFCGFLNSSFGKLAANADMKRASEKTPCQKKEFVGWISR